MRVPIHPGDRFIRAKEHYPMIHWHTLHDYLGYVDAKKLKPKLVIGCGHGAFYIHQVTHGPDSEASIPTYSTQHRFSHADSFTINAEGVGPDLYPDIDGCFPTTLLPNNTFDEVFIENIPHSEGLYKAAYNFLTPGGMLMDDRYYGNWFSGLNVGKQREETSGVLKTLGYVDIQFLTLLPNTRNGRKSEVVVAKKPHSICIK
jgi:hypothetical protein